MGPWRRMPLTGMSDLSASGCCAWWENRGNTGNSGQRWQKRGRYYIFSDHLRAD